MSGALLLLVLGIAVCAVSALLLHLAARKCRTAPPAAVWSGEGVATALSLGLVSVIVVGAALVIKGTVSLMPDPMAGIGLGLLIVACSIFGAVNIISRATRLADSKSSPLEERGRSSIKRAA